MDSADDHDGSPAINTANTTAHIDQTSTPTKKHKTGFLDLPAELRNRIYHLIIPTGCIIKLHF
ncbi:hypothetical protein Slin15195_G062100 [Septoria linicola]|uniref:Uncharacterized protein n=1 Tax=Septoria linicola TaxID=215465 RepID=A0A9Q9EIK8_9PEZI|nr:hypothetical protein Slin14017_G077910 [Septoria linicola]USW52891.1 hypothetical protein Slin15195_G062100 [Septoria linicola]